MSAPLISVIIPTRNRSAYLKQAIDSVCAQTYTNVEIIVVDDGSTDDTKNVVKAYGTRLKYFTQERKGASAARNHGIAKAQGEYVAFLDDDDIYAPEKLQVCIDYFLHHPDVIWVCTGFSFIDAAGAPLPRAAIVPAKEEITLHDIAMFTFINTCSVVVRRANLQAVGGFPEGVTVSEDYHTWAKLLKGGKGAAIKNNLVYYRLHTGNTKLPFWRILRENTRIIDAILTTHSQSLMPRETYIQNLHRIIADNLIYKRQWCHYACFRLWQKFL